MPAPKVVLPPVMVRLSSVVVPPPKYKNAALTIGIDRHVRCAIAVDIAVDRGPYR